MKDESREMNEKLEKKTNKTNSDHSFIQDYRERLSNKSAINPTNNTYHN